MAMMIMIVIMSVWLEYVSKLRLTTGLLFIPQVIYENGGPWWNNIGWIRLLILPPELSDNPTSRFI
jgi:hypothetical protein